MKHKTFHVFLGVEAVLCILLYCVGDSMPWMFSAVMAFPFEQIGAGLRALSLSGSVGNGVSVALYIALCLIPGITLLFLHRKRKLTGEDSLLAVLSVVLFVVFYFMINPGLISTYFGMAIGENIGKALLGGMVYSILCGYAVLRVLRLFFAANMSKLQKYLGILLYITNMLFVFLAFGVSFGNLLKAFETLRTGNTGFERHLGMSYAFLVLQYIVNTLPYLFNIAVVFSALNLLNELNADRYSQATVTASEKLSRLCGVALAFSVLSNIGFNLLQLLFAKTLRVVNGSVQIPLLSITFVMAVLLLARFIGENKQLKDDNDMFI